jgi:hypothetical protein
MNRKITRFAFAANCDDRAASGFTAARARSASMAFSATPPKPQAALRKNRRREE